MDWRAWFGLSKPAPQGPTLADVLAQLAALKDHVEQKVPPPPPPVGSLPRDCTCGHRSAEWVQRVEDGFVECFACYRTRMKDELDQHGG